MRVSFSEVAWRSVLLRAAFYALVWWVLAAGAVSSWSLGIPAVVLATWVSVSLAPPQALRLFYLPCFAVRFLWLSLVGGADVALRALLPGQRLAPAVIDYRTRLAPGRPRVVFVNCISLTPGTLSADLEEDHIRVHVLDGRVDHQPALRALEDAVARLLPPD